MSGIITEAFNARRTCRDEYDLHLQAAYERAEEATRGALLNARGRRAHIDPMSLFMGNQTRAHAYASEELLEHWAKFPRVTYAEFERQWVAAQEWAA